MGIFHQWCLQYLVGGFNLPLWKMMEFVSWDDDIPNIWKNKTCSKPPTRSSINGLNPMIKPMVWKIMQYLFISFWVYHCQQEATMTRIGMLTSDQEKLNPRECVTHPFQLLSTSCYRLKQRISYMALPSGKLSHNYGKIHHAIHG